MATRKPTRTTSAKALFQRMRRDHRRALERVGALEARLRPRGRGGDAEAGTPSDVLDLLGLPFDAHMVAEDEALYPALLAAIPAASGSIESLVAEHAEIRQMLRRLHQLVEEPATPARAEQLRVEVRDLAQLLRLHIAKEETLVFRLAPRLLVPREIAAVAAILRGSAPTPTRRPSTRSKGVSR